MSQLTRTALENLSVFYYIKEGILARNFSQEVIGDTLTYDTNLYNGQQRLDYVIVDSSNSLFKNIPITEGRGWLSFDITEVNSSEIYQPSISGYVSTFDTPLYNYSFGVPLKRESSYIIVRDQFNNIMDRSWYQIDYEGGRVRYPAPTTPSGIVASGILPSKIDYRFHTIAVVDGYPTADNIPPLPVIAIYPTTNDLEGYQLGGGVASSQDYVIDVFATSNAERRNILDTLKNGLYNRHTSVIDFNRCGYPLNQHGTINNKFIQNITMNNSVYQSYLTLNPGNGHLLYFVDIEVLYDTSPRNSMANAIRHTGRIVLKTKSFTDRDPQLVGKFNLTEEPPGGFDSLTVKGYSV